jgi:hypothetical protein
LGPPVRGQASKWTKAVRDRLPEWIATELQPQLEATLGRAQLATRLEIGGPNHDRLLPRYPSIKQGSGYVSPFVTLEFGGRSTVEPHQVLPATCDVALYAIKTYGECGGFKK